MPWWLSEQLQNYLFGQVSIKERSLRVKGEGISDLAEAFARGDVPTEAIHLSTGQKATAVGICFALATRSNRVLRTWYRWSVSRKTGMRHFLF